MSWPTVSLSEVAEINPRLSKEKRSQTEIDVAFLQMSSVSERGEILDVELRKLGDVVKGFTYFAQGDVIVAKITPSMENGKAAFIDWRIPTDIGFGSTEFHVIRAGPSLDGKFLFHLIWSDKFRFIAGKNMTGTAGQKRVPASFLGRYKFALPPLGEQKRIASILDKADEINKSSIRAIEIRDEIVRSSFLDMFGDPATNQKNWTIRNVGALGQVITGTTPPSSKEGMFGGDIPFVTPGDLETGLNITKRYLTVEGKDNSRTVRKGATLCCCIGATIGKTGITWTESTFNQQINAIDWGDEIEDMFGYYCMKIISKSFLSKARNTAIPILKKSAFQKICIPVPPIELQHQFANIVNIIYDLPNVKDLTENNSLSIAQEIFA